MASLRVFYETDEEVQAAAQTLRGLGGHARRFLAECVEKQGVKRRALSAAGKALENAGFVFVRNVGDVFEELIEITPTLAGEEALEVLDEEDEQ